VASCASVGRKTIRRDQIDYGNAIANAQQEQLLFNVVRLRYVDAPGSLMMECGNVSV
jgi:hypothetical protein